jgi:glycosyltransferase involved in cell wall biosynthesis
VLHLRGLPDPVGTLWWAIAQAFPDRIILVANALKQVLNPVVRWRGRVVYNGVPVPPPADRRAGRAALAARLGVSEEALAGDTIFLSLSSTVPFKGLHHLLDAAAEARMRGVRARYVIAGDGNDDRYVAWLRRRAFELGVGDIVHFFGYVSNTQPLLEAADVLVLPSVAREVLEFDGQRLEVRGNEGLPRSVLEAMASGIPSLCTDTAGVREQIEDGETGVIVPPADPRALALALERVAADSGWRVRAGQRAREVVRLRFPVEGASAGLASVLRELA